MIRTIEISNFRCYKNVKLDNLARLNIIVGDNGSGKTALLEAIFLPLTTTTNIVQRYRGQRGWDGLLTGTRRRLEDAMYGELFYKFDYHNPVQIQLHGDGLEARAFAMLRAPGPDGAPNGPVILQMRNADGATYQFQGDWCVNIP